MIRLENVLKTSFQEALKMPWRRLKNVCKISWICLEDVLKTFLDDNIFKTSWRCYEDVFARHLEDVLKASWRRLEDVLKTHDQDEYIVLDYDVLKISSEDGDKRYLQDAFIKTNVCWDSFKTFPIPKLHNNTSCSIVTLLPKVNRWQTSVFMGAISISKSLQIWITFWSRSWTGISIESPHISTFLRRFDDVHIV